MKEIYQQALSYLKIDPLRHLVHLKYLHLYADVVDCTFIQEDQSTGVLLSYRPEALAWDAKNYPNAGMVFLPVASDRAAAECLLAHVQAAHPSGTPFILKCAEEHTKEVFNSAYHLDFQRALISYTIGQIPAIPPDQEVVRSTTPDDQIISLFTNSVYTADENRKYFAEGACAFIIYEGKEPVCYCMAYRNFGRVWEIGALYTVEHARRKGYARRVVLAALSYLADRDLIPRYQAEHTNLPSLRLAESIGLEPCLHFEHYLCRSL